jgi:hypothetical protein
VAKKGGPLKSVKRAGFDGGYRFPVNAVCFNSVSA